jgi:hypothetical protein
VAAGWGDHIAAPAPPIHMPQANRVDVAQAGGSQVIVPATPTSADQRSQALQAMGGRQLSDGLGAGGAVDVQDVEAMAGGQADVGLRVARPPGQDSSPVASGVLDPVGNETAQRVLGGLAAARIPTRAAGPHHRVPVPTHWLEGAAVGERVVQRQHWDAAGGIAERRVPQQPAGAAHRASSAGEGRWRCRKLAALLRPQPAASARVRAVQSWPSDRGWA